MLYEDRIMMFLGNGKMTKYFILTLVSIFMLFSCANKTGSPDVLHLLVTDRGIKQKYSIPMKFSNGLMIVFSEDLKKRSNPFSYTAPREVEVEIINDDLEDYILFSSFEIDDRKLKKASLSKFVIGLADKKLWNTKVFEHNGAKFTLVIPKKSSIEGDHWKESVSKIWDYYKNKFGQFSKTITFIELDWAPLSGGPLGENVLGIFSQKLISIQSQNEIRNDLGWLAQDSTESYVKSNYKNSINPWKEYLVGTYAHEMAHLYFGFGKTRQRVDFPHDLWFSLGMGMLYDEEITKQLTGNSPAIFQASESVYNRFASIRDIDQRLVYPETTYDKYYKLDRKKVYAHSKAHKFLKALRVKTGEKEFDQATKKFLIECSRCENGYEDFKKFLPLSESSIKQLEIQFKVY